MSWEISVLYRSSLRCGAHAHKQITSFIVINVLFSSFILIILILSDKWPVLDEWLALSLTRLQNKRVKKRCVPSSWKNIGHLLHAAAYACVLSITVSSRPSNYSGTNGWLNATRKLKQRWSATSSLFEALQRGEGLGRCCRAHNSGAPGGSVKGAKLFFSVLRDIGGHIVVSEAAA